MVDRLDRLEAELAALRPVAVPYDLRRAIDDRLHEARRWNIADRCLAGAMSLGAIAACVIGGIVILQNFETRHLSPVQAATPIAHRGDPPAGPMWGDYQQALARAGTSSAGLFR